MEHSTELITEPLPQEVLALGLADAPFLIPQEQVQARYGIIPDGTPKLIIHVNDIEVLAMDPVSNNVRYKIVGFRQYMQNWDAGGSYFAPEPFEPEETI